MWDQAGGAIKDMDGAPEGISSGQIGVIHAPWADQNWQRRQAWGQRHDSARAD